LVESRDEERWQGLEGRRSRTVYRLDLDVIECISMNHAHTPLLSREA
jgi:hypothetical protein